MRAKRTSKRALRSKARSDTHSGDSSSSSAPLTRNKGAHSKWLTGLTVLMFESEVFLLVEKLEAGVDNFTCHWYHCFM